MGRRGYINIAEEQAYKSVQNFRHGAVLVKDGKILSKGHNKPIASDKPGQHSVHAEVNAIKNSGKSCENAILYVVRVNNNSGLANSKPCKHCLHFMKVMKVQRVFYSSDCGIENFYLQ